MKIIDSTTYFEEDLMMDLRFNVLDPYVDEFIICEACFSHSGKEKKINFDKKKFPLLKMNMIVIKISKRYFRPNEVDNLIGNANKAKKILKWKPKTNIHYLIKEMMDSDLEYIRKSTLR